jgi:hypothetical protein
MYEKSASECYNYPFRHLPPMSQPPPPNKRRKLAVSLVPCLKYIQLFTPGWYLAKKTAGKMFLNGSSF